MYNDFDRNKAEFEYTAQNFVETELNLALTFCRMAKETDDSEKRSRNLQNAEKAYESGLKAFDNLSKTVKTFPLEKLKVLFENVHKELSSARKTISL